MFGTGFLTSPAAAATAAAAVLQTELPNRPKALQKQANFPDIRDVVQKLWAATAELTTESSDEWVKKYGTRTKAVASTENGSLLDRLREGTGEDFDGISPFFDGYPSSRVSERQARCVKGFCESSPSAADNPPSDDTQSVQSNHNQETSAWVSDRNWYPKKPLDPSTPNKSYERILDDQGLSEVLQKQRFSGNGKDELAGPARRIYINKPNKNSIIALLRTTPPSQVPGFKELMANYLTGDPSPVVKSREIFWWGNTCFLFTFKLPFFATTSQAQQDNRRGFNGKRPLRPRHDISFLTLGVDDQDYYGEDEPPRERFFLLGGVCSIVVTGRSEQYWTAACLDDDLPDDNEDEPRLAIADEAHQNESETDPIILKVSEEALSPRAYALAALATALAKIVDYHEDIQAEFETSLSHHTSTSLHGSPDNISPQEMQEWRKRYLEVLHWVIDCNSRIIEKLNRFLSHDLLLTPEGLPRHPLWQSATKEERVPQSLTEIRDSLEHLSGVDSELRRFLKTCMEERRELKNKYQDEQIKYRDEQSRRDKNLQKITFAGFVLAILNLAAQIYAGRPEHASALSSPGFMVLSWGSVILCVLMFLVSFWEVISRFLRELPQHLYKHAGTVKRAVTEQLGCLKAFLGIGKYLLLAIRGALRVRRIGMWLRKLRIRAFREREGGILPM